MEVVDSVLKMGSRLVADELKKFLVARGIAEDRYRLILRRLAEEPASWTQVKTFLEAKESKRVSPSIFTQLLGNLVDAGFVEKSGEVYKIADPILSHALRSGLV
jgi:AAA+ ATPase superfamily predicted ATPase